MLAGAAPVAAFEPVLPWPATLTASEERAPDSYALPLGPWADGSLATELREGRLRRSAWMIDNGEVTSLGLLEPLRSQLRDAGFEIRFECATRACGGFDFRFATPVLPEPAMHVDLGDFRFLSATRETAEGREAASLLVSRSGRAGFVQLVHVDPDPRSAPGVVASSKSAEPSAPGPAVPSEVPGAGTIALALEYGSVVLEGLTFATGGTTLSADSDSALAALGAYLAAHPDRSIALVGHTDAEGALAGNLDLSRRRAAAVRDHLIRAFGIAPDRIAAEGVGYLAPRASNLDPEGRARNRRVEVMLTDAR